MKHFILVFIWSLATICGYAQLSTHESPVGYGNLDKMVVHTDSIIPVVVMPSLDMNRLEKEDKEAEELDLPPRFGYLHNVNYNLHNSGIWKTMANGDKIWQLHVVCPEALSINFLFDKFWLPEGGKLFIYSANCKHSIGAFTSLNNKGDSLNIRGFSTGLVYGNEVVVEYYQPQYVTIEAMLSIKYIVHGYRYISINNRTYGESGSCQVNVNCSEGSNWQKEKKAVALILVNGNRICTGSLINTTDNSSEPYLLTANHCISSYGDSEFEPDLDSFSFYWNYESPGCSNTNIEPANFATSGATIVANDYSSDFALLRLTEDPKNIIGYNPFYLGWDNSGNSGLPGVCIHHPSGDVKKISTVAFQPQSTSYVNNNVIADATHWRVTWSTTSNGHGTTEGGSSGSPLLNSLHRIIGQLHGGYSSCDDTNEPDWYGKFSISWTGYNENSIYRRLNCWLDTLQTGYQIMNGLELISDTVNVNSNTTVNYNNNIRVMNNGLLRIQGNLTLSNNCDVVVGTGGKIVIDGGTFIPNKITLLPGSQLNIINNGILHPLYDFVANVGSEVNILKGQIQY